MQTSIGNNLIPRGINFPDGLALIRQAGFNGVELWLEKDGYFSVTTDNVAVRQILRQVQEHGLLISNVSTGLHWETPLSARDPEVRRRAVAIVRRQIELAHLLGTNEILVVAGLVTSEVTPAECYQRCLDSLAPLGREAQAAGVVIGLENCNSEQRFLMGPLEFVRFLDALGPGFGAHLDVGNIHDTGFPEQWVEVLGARIARVHVKDTLRRRGRGGGSVYTNVFLGDNNWPAIMQALRKVGYDGWLVAEMEAPYRYCPDQQFYDTAAALRRLMALV